MKKYIFFGSCFILLCCFIGFANSNSAQNLIIDESYKDYSFNFEPLSSNEILSYEHSNTTLSIFRETENKNKTLISTWENIRFGNYTISKNQKKIIFSITAKGYFEPTFVIDGKKGMAKYLFDAPRGYQTDQDNNYLIGTDWNYQNKQKADYNEIYNLQILVYDINRNETCDLIDWPLANKFGTVMFLHSKDDKYDFRLVYDSEGLLYAEAFYNVQKKEFKVTIDLTKESPERPLEYKTIKKRG